MPAVGYDYTHVTESAGTYKVIWEYHECEKAKPINIMPCLHTVHIHLHTLDRIYVASGVCDGMHVNRFVYQRCPVGFYSFQQWY